MFGTNRVKLGGCALLLAQVHPLFAYAAVGFGAAAYSPVKYGIFPELFASAALVGANAWIEVLTVVSILLGVGLGSLLMAPGRAMPHLLAAPAANTTLLISMLYGIAVFARRCPVPLRALLCRLHPPGDCCANFACALRAMARPEKPGFIGRHQSVLGRIRDLAVPDSELGCTSVGLAAASACGSVR